MEPNCVSYNFKGATRKCDLNNSTLREGEGNIEKNTDYIYYGAKVQIICLLEGNKLTVKLPIKEVLMDVFFFSCPRTDVRINLARTKQPVKPVSQVKATAVCVLLDLTESIARTVRKL